MELLLPYTPYIALFLVFVVLPWMAWKMVVWAAEAAGRQLAQRHAAAALPTRFLSTANKQQMTGRQKTHRMVGSLVAFVGGYGAGAWAIEYGQLENLAISVFFVAGAMTFAKLLEGPVTTFDRRETQRSGIHGDEDDLLGWQFGLNSTEYSGLPNFVRGDQLVDRIGPTDPI